VELLHLLERGVVFECDEVKGHLADVLEEVLTHLPGVGAGLEIGDAFEMTCMASSEYIPMSLNMPLDLFADGTQIHQSL